MSENSVTTPAEFDVREREFWNGPGGERWVRNQEGTDAMLAPVATLALDLTQVQPGEHVVDVGCGCGVTTLELGRRVGPGGTVLGLDVSAPMVEVARRRVAPGQPVTFVTGDAATHGFSQGAASLLFSRFGVMFFGDPSAAFANLRTALRPGGRLVFACWQAFDKNPWMSVPLNAAYEHAPRLPKPGPEDPGPFSFSDEARVRRILDAAGFSSVVLQPADLALDLARGGGLDAAVDFALEVGAASRALQDKPSAVVDAARDSIRRALEPYATGSAVSLPAAIWLVTAVSR